VVRMRPVASLLTAAVVVVLSLALASSCLASSSAPEITSVTPITNQQKQTVTIQGRGFGDVQPELLELSDGSVDTVWGGNTPCIVVYDRTNLLSAGATGDWNGFTNGSPDLIGIFLESWTDTEIVLGGFGTGLGSVFSWSQVSEGDDIQIQIRTAEGFATYDIVSGNGSSVPPPSGSSLPPSHISIIAEPLSTAAGSAVNVFGTLTDVNGSALQNKTVVLSYTFPGIDSWIPISSGLTDEQGKYTIQWINTASGTFTLKAEWSGDESGAATSNQTSLSFLPYQNQQQNFIFESNSTIYDLGFNANASSLTFNVTGPSGSTGYLKATIAKSILPDSQNLQATMDGEAIAYSVESTADAWVFTFNYSHSTHQIVLNIASNTAQPTIIVTIACLLGAILCTVTVRVGLRLLRKNPASNQPQTLSQANLDKTLYRSMRAISSWGTER
jgi:hypothetical protein